jgi:heterodisulfide reductase subunit A
MSEEPQPAEEVRIGVFVCHCGTNIGGYVDVPAVTEYAKTLPDVVHAEERLYACSEDSLVAIKGAIKEHDLNRVVVASCTPRTHAVLFQKVCEEAGLNKYLFHFVNIREQCSWVHMDWKDTATEKAKDLVRMGVTSAKYLTPLEETKIDVRPSSLVIGGGISGITASLSLADQGFEVHLVEKEDAIGGYLRTLHTLWEVEGDPLTAMGPTIKKVHDHPKIKVYTGSEVERVDGFIGNFNVGVKTKDGTEDLEVGTIIVATGATELIPEGLYGYGEIDNVMTLAEFEHRSKDGTLPENFKDVAFIQCVGARGQKVEYCSRVCCNVAIKTAVHLMDSISERMAKQAGAAPAEGGGEAPAPPKPAAPEKGGRRRRARRRPRDGAGPSRPAGRPGAAAGGRPTITIFNRTINAYGVHHEMFYNKAREKRIKFTRFHLDNVPKVSKADGGKIKIEYYAEALGGWRDITVDLVILSTPLVSGPSAEGLSKLMKIPTDQDGFFLEAHMKLRPVDFVTDGIYLCGTCRAPADITEAVMQAYGAASRAGIPMANGHVTADAIISVVDPEKCRGCGRCAEMCEFGAITLVPVDDKDWERKVSQVNPALCKGCGKCNIVCCNKAIHVTTFKRPQITSMIESFARGE